MPTPTDGNHLAEKRYVTVVVRLVLDQHGQLIHGELVDAGGMLEERFIGLHGLIRAMRNWLASQAPADDSDRA